MGVSRGLDRVDDGFEATGSSRDTAGLLRAAAGHGRW